MKFFVILTMCILFAVSCTENNNSGSTTETEQNNTETAEVAEWNNTHCPVMEGKVKEDGGSTMYQGKLVRFCCPKCIKKFNENTEKYHETLVSYSQGTKSDTENHDNHDDDHSGHNH